jgi:predicted ester cyclase
MSKAVVLRFNEEVLVKGDLQVLDTIVSPSFTNHTAPAGTDKGKAGLPAFYNNVLKPAFPDLTIEIHEMFEDGETMITRKTIRGTPGIPFMGFEAGRKVEMPTIDIVKVKDGQYVDHWAERHIQPA